LTRGWKIPETPGRIPQVCVAKEPNLWIRFLSENLRTDRTRVPPAVCGAQRAGVGKGEVPFQSQAMSRQASVPRAKASPRTSPKSSASSCTSLPDAPHNLSRFSLVHEEQVVQGSGWVASLQAGSK
jgi:hypothetical protein